MNIAEKRCVIYETIKELKVASFEQIAERVKMPHTKIAEILTFLEQTDNIRSRCEGTDDTGYRMVYEIVTFI